jgi:hypothetical protein
MHHNAEGAVCGTPGRLASWSIRRLDSLPPDLPTKTLPAGVARPHPVREIDGRTCFKDRNPPTTLYGTRRVPALH